MCRHKTVAIGNQLSTFTLSGFNLSERRRGVFEVVEGKRERGGGGEGREREREGKGEREREREGGGGEGRERGHLHCCIMTVSTYY